MTRRSYLALAVLGVALAVVGAAAIEWYGSAGSVPREEWWGKANFADVLGGLLAGGGLLMAVVGVYGFRNG